MPDPSSPEMRRAEAVVDEQDQRAAETLRLRAENARLRAAIEAALSALGGEVNDGNRYDPGEMWRLGLVLDLTAALHAKGPTQ